MKTLVCIEPGSFAYVQADPPVLQKGHAIIKIKRIGVCGTDLHAYRGTQPYFSYPRVLGHEISGTLVDADDPPGFEAGDAITFIPYFNCGTCVACHAGKPNCCVNIEVCGVHRDGGMVEYLQVPSYSLVRGEGLTYDELALVEPLAIGAHSIRRANAKKNDYVVVLGAGPIGLGTMAFGQIAGADIIAVDTNNDRLDFCRDVLGIQHTINPGEVNAIDRMRDMTAGDMAGVVVDATGNLKAINGGIDYLAHGGRYVLTGLQKEAFSFSHPEFHKREATLMSSRNATRLDFDHVIASMQQGLINTQSYITHRVHFSDVKNEFDNWLKPGTRVIKAMIHVD